MPKFFITSTGTGIGKTLVTTSLCWQLRQLQKPVTALKPIISGYDPHDTANDSALILKSCAIEPTTALQAGISPWRYAPALAPSMAAALESKTIDMKHLIAFCQQDIPPSSTLLVEGAGGVMAPITDSKTVLDWITRLNWPVILVAGTYLGSISHTLTAIETLKSKVLSLHALILSESENSTVSLEATTLALEKFLPQHIPVVKLPRLVTTTEPWTHAPALHWLCQNPNI